jgi:hypothetical protein
MLASWSTALLGLLLGVVFLVISRRRPPRSELRFYAAGLAVAALIYVAFGSFRHAGVQLPMELVGLAIFSAASWAGLRWGPAWIGLGWIAHMSWDLLLHSPAAAPVPAWYPSLCAGFDPVVGVYVLIVSGRFRGKP